MLQDCFRIEHKRDSGNFSPAMRSMCFKNAVIQGRSPVVEGNAPTPRPGTRTRTKEHNGEGQRNRRQGEQ